MNDSFDNTEWAIRLAKILVVSLLVWIFSFWRSEKIPLKNLDNQSLQKEPLQKPTFEKPFQTQVSGHSYQIEPVYDYEVWGLVVSNHDSNSWKDSVHEAWNDYINTKDICIIWGQNLKNASLSELKFRNGSWTCYVTTNSSQAWQQFNTTQISNNHVIPANAEIKKLMARSSVGDEIRMRGQLVNYRINNGPSRNSSTVRTDTDNGACEIIYVKEFETFKSHNSFWLKLSKLGKWLSIMLFFSAFFLMFFWRFFFETSHSDLA